MPEKVEPKKEVEAPITKPAVQTERNADGKASKPVSGWKLITPPDNWKNASPVPEAAFSTLERIARQYGGTYKEDKEEKKVYFDPTKPRAAPRAEEAKDEAGIKLPIVYYSQLNSQLQGGVYANRMCQSSSVATLVKTLRPGVLSDSINADDDYLTLVLTYGETTDSTAQLHAARKLLADYAQIDFHNDLSFADVDVRLASSIPVPIGILHHGPISHPTGDGHWVVVVGKTGDGKGYYVHDPAGELDLINGRYISTDGKYQVYSAENLGKRWMCAPGGESTPGKNGWGYIAKRLKNVAGKKIQVEQPV